MVQVEKKQMQVAGGEKTTSNTGASKKRVKGEGRKKKQKLETIKTGETFGGGGVVRATRKINPEPKQIVKTCKTGGPKKKGRVTLAIRLWVSH